MRVVILGTGTDVGKTYVTACLGRAVRQHQTVLALKPIESGAAPGATGDAGVIAAAAGHTPLLSPWRFEAPVSPHLAARRSGTTLDLTAVANWIAGEEQRARPDVTLVELAGGAFSPLGPGLTNVDLALALEPALWLLVASDSLGVLHDLTTTTRALPRPPDAVVLSSARAPDASTGTNAEEIRRLGIADVLEVIARDSGECPRSREWLVRRAVAGNSTIGPLA